MASVGAELLAAARGGDVQEVERICATASTEIINYQDEHSGNSALHMACANGHVACAEILLKHGAKHIGNSNGNTPLHWAVQNKHIEVARVLLSNVQDIDVLAQNGFGRGCVTEAFQTENTDMVALLLEHPSASDEKLAAGSGLATGDSKVTIEEEDDESTIPAAAPQDNKPKILQETVLEFAFGDKKPTLKARELALDMDKSAFGTTAAEDITGVSIWSASLILSRWVIEDAARYAGKSVCELGAGCGVSGLACYLYTQASRVVLTDLYEHTVDNLKHNADLNRARSSEGSNPEGCHECGTLQRFTVENPEGKLMLCGRCCVAAYCSRECQKAAWKAHKTVCKQLALERKPELSVAAIDWADPETYGPRGVYDIILGSDLVYHKDIAPVLAQVVEALLAPQGQFLHVASQARDALVEFKQAMEARGFECHIDIVPDRFKENPLVGSANLFDLHFNEMDDTYCMYTFTKLTH
ncbi:hypothetical protein AC1031_015670 [Aphanomyces cochlioides]|nr:hypothetical protein AC1031_015670 [Aphanomyces cochlioides]